MNPKLFVRQIMLETGALSECELHNEVYDPLDGSAVEDAYRAGEKLIESQEMTGTSAEWRAIVDRELTEHGDECGYCAKNADS